MKTMTITAMAVAALAIATVATFSSSSVRAALARTDGVSQTSMPIAQITANAQNLPAQSFDAY